RLSAVPTPRIRPPGAVIPCGTTTFKQLSRLDTDPADFLHPASDVCLLAPAGFATGLVASLCPWKDLHLLDNLNRFHRGSPPPIPSVTSLARHDTPVLGAGEGSDTVSPARSTPMLHRHRPRYCFNSFFSSVRKRQSVPWAMIFWGLLLIIPASCRRRA